MTNMDILAAIDAAVGCQQCGEALLGSVSDDFCGPLCQEGWHAGNAVPLVDYREPWYRPCDFPGIGQEAFRSSPERLRRTDIARVHVVGIGDAIDARLTFDEIQQHIGEFIAVVNVAFAAAASSAQLHSYQMRSVSDQINRAYRESLPVPNGPIAAARERALQLRRSRNTGPPSSRRAPRTIGHPTSSPRS